VLTCAYCGRKSLMQNIEEQIMLRGIITQVSETPAAADHVQLIQTESKATAKKEPAEEPPEIPSDDEFSEPSKKSNESDVLHEDDSSGSTEIISIATLDDSSLDSDDAFFDPDSQVSDGDSFAESPTDTLKKETLILLAVRAAAARQTAEFNSYSRQAIDCDPADPRMYALRSRLIEEANGFARATFLSPNWLIQTPRYKSWLIAQHFSMLNTAVRFSPQSAHASLTTEIGSLIASQIRENFVEHARLRLGKRPFKGRFHRKDLRQARQTVDACLCINESVVPQIANDLQMAIRTEIMRLDPKLSDHLQRIGL
jgi:hypothetical protein